MNLKTTETESSANARPREPLLDFIRDLCKRFGPRVSGTAAEAKAAGYIRETLAEFCEEVSIEEFRFSPKYVQGSITIFLAAYLLCLATYLYVPAFAATLLLIHLSIFYLTRFKGYEILDRLFSRATSQNVIGKVKPRGATQRIVIFSGHHDSAKFMPLFDRPYRKLVIPAFHSILGSHVVLMLAICTRFLAGRFTWLTPVSWLLFGLSVLGGVVFLLFRLFLFSEVPVMGANDNLAGVAVAVAAARRFAENRSQGTEVWAVSFGAEECGLRGSKRFAARHHIELSNAYLVNIEMVGAGSMIVVAGEKSAGTKHSPQVVSMIIEAARRIGIVIPTVVAPFGETDATPFSRLRLKASTIASIDDENFPPNWHVFDDVPENIDEAKLNDALKICVECVKIIEK